MRFFDLFSGMGGFRLGLEREGYECVGWCEIDEWAQKLYRAFFKPSEKEVFHEDARRIIPEQLPEFDVLCAGFPCQSFSVAGKRRGFEDTRGTLFFEIVRIARAKRPAFLLLENVKGLLNHDRGRTFEVILKTLDELGYDAEWQVLNSKDFGLPQNRERVFIIGHLRGKSRPQIFPLTESDKVYYEPPRKAQGEGKRFRCSPDYSRAIDANYRKGGGSRTHLLFGERMRIFTPLECFRLQGFPDEMYYTAKKLGIADTHLYRLTGNAVSVPVVQSIARKLKRVNKEVRS